MTNRLYLINPVDFQDQYRQMPRDFEKGLAMQKKSVASAVFLILSSLLFGFLSGAFVATRVIGGGGMGWDRLADALLGMVVGLVLASILSGVLLSLLDSGKRWIAVVLFFGGSVLVWVLFRIVPMAPMT